VGRGIKSGGGGTRCGAGFGRKGEDLAADACGRSGGRRAGFAEREMRRAAERRLQGGGSLQSSLNS
jgi:hypothetical protein